MTKNLPVNPDAIRSGVMSPITSGTIGDGSRKMPSVPSGSCADLLSFSPAELEAIGSLEAEYKTAIPPYYFSLIDPSDANDPIRLQAVPSPLEQLNPSGYELEDPLEEDKDSPVPGLTHRYPDRALLVTTHVCTMYCRFCTRKRATMVRGGWDAISRNDERMIEYVRDHPEIRDVIVSGGDPLTLPTTKLRFFLDNLAVIPHVDVIRIGTRVPVTLPQKLYDPQPDRPAWLRPAKCGFRRTSIIRARSPRRRPASAWLCSRPACRSTITPSCSRASTIHWKPCVL